MEPEKALRALKASITEKLRIDQRLNPIHLGLEDDSIVIEGTVEKVSQKKRILLKAMELFPGVIDRLRVKPASHMTDREIENHLNDAFSQEPTLKQTTIRVEVRDGCVDLEGIVPSLCHKRIAGVLAWWVPGSRDVINSLEVVPPEEDSDDEVVEALRLVLEKDSLVDATRIGISSKDWVVTLTGTVNSESERDAAEDDAWYIWGVNDVINNIEVRT